jgi:hypothetical protein
LFEVRVRFSEALTFLQLSETVISQGLLKIGVSDDILLIKKFGIRASGGKQLFV